MSELGRGDENLVDLHMLVRAGANGLLEKYGDMERVVTIVQDLYAYAWLQLDGFLFDDNPLFQAETEPSEEIMAVFAPLWEIDDPDMKACADVALTGYFMRDEDDIVTDMLFGDGAPVYYPDKDVVDKIEEICREGELHDDPDYLARWLLSYASTVRTTWIVQPPGTTRMTPLEAQLGIRVILNDHGPAEYS